MNNMWSKQYKNSVAIVEILLWCVHFSISFYVVDIFKLLLCGQWKNKLTNLKAGVCIVGYIRNMNLFEHKKLLYAWIEPRILCIVYWVKQAV